MLLLYRDRDPPGSLGFFWDDDRAPVVVALTELLEVAPENLHGVSFMRAPPGSGTACPLRGSSLVPPVRECSQLVVTLSGQKTRNPREREKVLFGAGRHELARGLPYSPTVVMSIAVILHLDHDVLSESGRPCPDGEQRAPG